MHIFSHSKAATDWIEAFGASSLLVDEWPPADLNVQEALYIAGEPIDGGQPVHLFNPRTLKQALDAALLLAKRIGCLPTAMQKIMALEAELADLHQSIGLTRGANPAILPSVLLLEDLNPPRAAGYWMPDAISQSGGRPLGPSSGSPPESMDWDKVFAINPDWIVVLQAGQSAEESARRFEEKAPPKGCKPMPAVTVACIDGKKGYERAGPHLYTLIRLLARMMYCQALQTDSDPDVVWFNVHTA